MCRFFVSMVGFGSSENESGSATLAKSLLMRIYDPGLMGNTVTGLPTDKLNSLIIYVNNSWKWKALTQRLFIIYWVTQKLPQICTVILRIRIGKVAWFAVYICGNFWVTQYMKHNTITLLIIFKNLFMKFNEIYWGKIRI